MGADTSGARTHEREVQALNGWGMLVFNLAVLFGGAALLVYTIVAATGGGIGAGAVALRIGASVPRSR